MQQLYQIRADDCANAEPSFDFSAEPSDYRLIESEVGPQLFVVDRSRLYGISSETTTPPTNRFSEDDFSTFVERLQNENPVPAIGSEIVPPPPLKSLSLNVAQACNMSCSYCYADEGRFGGNARLMDESVAFQSIDRLFRESDSTSTVVIGFMGGEPLIHRRLVHSATRYAIDKKEEQDVRFSLTTNGTLLTPEDVRLFNEFPFTIQVSIDGDRETNDKARPIRGGGSSYDRILEGLKLFEEFGRPNQLSARVTVTPQSKNLVGILTHLLELGFDDVGFAPVLVSPNPNAEFSVEDFDSFLQEMIVCGELAKRELRKGHEFPFSNFTTALDEIHQGSHRPYPCGAGAGYLSVNAEGKLYACHRLIDDNEFAMGDVEKGLNHDARSQHLDKMHVDKMEPCKGCWARYLCGGGCYHEVTRRGRPGCEYVRGWLEFCLSSYAELAAETENRIAGNSDDSK